MLACQDVGSGKLPEPEVLLDHIAMELARPKTLSGIRVTVTAGPTQEALDPVRYLTNHSSGRMGYAIAREAMLRGAQVTLISGPTSLPPVPGVEMKPITSAQEMFEAVQTALPDTDILIKAAAVADYRPASVSDQKIKKGDGDMSIPLERTQDILGWVAQNRHPGLFVCGFSMETEHMLENSAAKLQNKHLDMIVANNLKEEGAGFGVPTNRVTILTSDEAQELPIMGKDQVAEKLLDAIEARR
jgi:phosphopantothenoylcysteine decarboxylase/phosphopantothenate--cysteine ligase